MIHQQRGYARAFQAPDFIRGAANKSVNFSTTWRQRSSDRPRVKFVSSIVRARWPNTSGVGDCWTIERLYRESLEVAGLDDKTHHIVGPAANFTVF